MRRAALIQYAYGREHVDMLDVCRKRHQRYCDIHDIDYLASAQGLPALDRPPHWRKVELLIETLAIGYESVAWLDADCVIVDLSFNVFAASGFGIAVCECFDSPAYDRHLNTGFLLCANSISVRAFMDEWNRGPTGGKNEDQDVFIEMMAARPHRDLLTILPNRFNCLDVHMEARNPFIRAFHGRNENRVDLIRDLVSSLEIDA